MHAQAFGHVVLNVRDLQRSEAFYQGAWECRSAVASPIPCA